VTAAPPWPPSPSLAAQLRLARAAFRSRDHRPSFREWLTSPDYCGKAPSPALLALVDASEGHTLSIPAPLCEQLFRCPPEALPREPRRVVALSAGGRSGKTSNCLAPKALHAAFTVGVRRHGDAAARAAHPEWPELAPGEKPRCLLFAPKRKLAKQAYNMALGLLKASPLLKSALTRETTENTGELTVRRADGIEVDILIATADKGGQDARSGTLLFCGLDEADFCDPEEARAIFDAAITRLVPGAQFWAVSTPWIEGEGLIEGWVKEDWGRHRDALVVARASTRLLNPSWDPDGSIERAERARPGGDENAEREINAIPFARGTSRWFPPDAIRAAVALLPPRATPADVGGGADFGHINDNSAFVSAARYPGGQFAALDLLQILSSSMQLPSATYRAVAMRALANGVHDVAADAHAKANVVEVWDPLRVGFIDAASKDRMYKGARAVLVEKRLALGGLPEDDREDLAAQLGSIVAKKLTGGGVQISAPRKRVDEMANGGGQGGHADAVSALVAALWRVGSCDPSLWQDVAAAARWARAGGGDYGGRVEDPWLVGGGRGGAEAWRRGGGGEEAAGEEYGGGGGEMYG
jgi:hypothetical protein